MRTLVIGARRLCVSAHSGRALGGQSSTPGTPPTRRHQQSCALPRSRYQRGGNRAGSEPGREPSGRVHSGPALGRERPFVLTFAPSVLLPGSPLSLYFCALGYYFQAIQLGNTLAPFFEHLYSRSPSSWRLFQQRHLLTFRSQIPGGLLLLLCLLCAAQIQP